MTVQNPRLRSFADNAICFGIGAMLHEIAVVDMEVIDGYTWHGGLTTHESTVFVMRYKECYFDRGFDCIARTEHTVYQSHDQTTNDCQCKDEYSSSFFHNSVLTHFTRCSPFIVERKPISVPFMILT